MIIFMYYSTSSTKTTTYTTRICCTTQTTIQTFSCQGRSWTICQSSSSSNIINTFNTSMLFVKKIWIWYGFYATTRRWGTYTMSSCCWILLLLLLLIVLLLLLLIMCLLIWRWWWGWCCCRWGIMMLIMVGVVMWTAYSGVNSSAAFWTTKRWCWGGGVPNRGAVANWATAAGWFWVETEGFWERTL